VSRRLGALAAMALALLAAPGSAHADFGLAPGSFHVEVLDAAGQPQARAGAHPDRFVTSFALTTRDDEGADGNLKELAIDLPTGMAGDPAAVPPCPRALFGLNRCPREAQVGVMGATFAGFGSFRFPLYEIAPRPGELAEFGFFALLFPVRFVVGLRADGDYGTRIAMRDLPESVPLTAGRVELWGIPADHQSGTEIARKPLLSNPTSCDAAAPVVALHLTSWQQPRQPIDATTQATEPLTGCERVPFDVNPSVALDTPAAETPSGLSVDVTVPQSDAPDGEATSEVRAFAATLPAGLTLSPGVADGLAACDDEQLGAGTTRDPACPPGSQLGTVELETPVGSQPFTGGIYFAGPLPHDGYRVFATASGPGVVLKLVGSLEPDPQTGQLSLALDDLPALPFSRLRLHFEDGARAPLATPATCGPGAVAVSVAPYRGGAPLERSALLEVISGPGGAPCVGTLPFAPSFAAGSSPALGGRDSAFSMTVRLADGQQPLDHFTTALPAGVTARLAGVARCAGSLAARAACPAASRLGSVSVEAGAGPQPLALKGDAYLTGPHAGAPFGVALMLRARAGPLDLGTIVVLAALQLDPADAHVTVVTDALPQIVAGVPLRLRTIAIDIDRPGFLRNPTSCAPTRVTAAFRSLDDAPAGAAARYALGGCRALRFAPSASLALGPARELVRGGHPALTIGLRSGADEATLRTARVALPSMVALDPSALPTLCTAVRARHGDCPPASVVGRARVRTPLLPFGLGGPVDVVAPSSGSRPELWAMLGGGGGVRLRLRGATAVARDGRVTTSFAGLPDIPIASFSLSLRGGREGLLTLTRSLCGGTGGRPLRILVSASLRGHNGALRATRVRAHTACHH
jgi:hypothetical protein